MDRIASFVVVWFNLLSSMAASHISMIYLICLIIPRICGKTSECCYEKQVGNVTYTLVERSNTSMAYNCVDDCIYEETNVEGSRVCFRTGNLPVRCLREDGKSLEILNSKLTLFNLKDVSVGSKRPGTLLEEKRQRFCIDYK